MEDNKDYSVSINTPRKSFRIHIKGCREEYHHANHKKNQTHIPNLTLEEAKTKLEECDFKDKQFCGHCLKHLNSVHKTITSLKEFNQLIKDIDYALVGVDGWKYIYIKSKNKLVALDNDNGDIELSNNAKWLNQIEHIDTLSNIWTREKFDFIEDLLE